MQHLLHHFHWRETFQSGSIMSLLTSENRHLRLTHSSVGLSFPPALVSPNLAVDFDNVSFSEGQLSHVPSCKVISRNCCADHPRSKDWEKGDKKRSINLYRKGLTKTGSISQVWNRNLWVKKMVEKGKVTLNFVVTISCAELLLVFREFSMTQCRHTMINEHEKSCFIMGEEIGFLFFI